MSRPCQNLRRLEGRKQMTDAAPSTRRARATLLAPFSGEEPPAPGWFADALAATPERSVVTVDGAAIETLAWGARGERGLLFLHGNGAHADWWDFIAPFFADRFRVAAMSWSGMGRSDWREDYSIDQHVDEAVAAGEAAGVFDAAQKPVIVAHSFGSLPALRLADRMPDRLAGMVIVDPPLFSEATRAARKPADPEAYRIHRIYPSLAEALARFRFAPEQPCENLFIADHIARHGLKQVEGGWTWRFDPRHWRRGNRKHDFDAMFAHSKVPVALVLGASSVLYNSDDLEHLDGLCAAASAPKTVITNAAHHVMVDQPLAFIDVVRRQLGAFVAAP
jgi:pimeloyl-ACP methyl ester carboxylesterase